MVGLAQAPQPAVLDNLEGHSLVRLQVVVLDLLSVCNQQAAVPQESSSLAAPVQGYLVNQEVGTPAQVVPLVAGA